MADENKNQSGLDIDAIVSDVIAARENKKLLESSQMEEAQAKAQAADLEAANQASQAAAAAPDVVSGLQGVSMGPVSAPVKTGALPPTGSMSQDAIGQDKLAQINQLEASGQISPETAIRWRQSLGLDLGAQGLSPEQMNREDNLKVAQQAPELANLSAQALQGTGLNTMSLPAPLAPIQGSPTMVPDVQAQAEAQQLAAVEAEQAQAQEQARKVAAQEAHQASIEKQAAARTNAVDQSVAEKTKGKNWGSLLAQSIAIMIGAYSQGLTGAKENPAITMLDKIAEQEAAKAKLDAEEKAALRKQLYDEAMLKLKEAELKTNNEVAKAQIAKLMAEVAEKREAQAAAQGLVSSMQSGKGFSVLQLHALPEKDRERAVQLPNGLYMLAARSEDAKKVTEQINDIKEARQGLKGLQNLADYFDNNPIKKIFDRTAIAEADALQRAIIGKMRLQLFGPGVLTDTEQKIAANIVRNPSDLMTLASSNKAAYNVLMKKLEYSQRQRLRSAGVALPPSENEMNIRKLMQARPGMKESEAMSVLINTGNWKTEDGME